MLRLKKEHMENNSQIAACDAEVLRYFRKHGPAPISDAKRALADTGSAEYRIVALAKPDAELLAEEMDTEIEAMCSLHQGLGVYRITPKGEIALDNYLAEQKQHKRELWLKSMWLPIAVSFVTALLTLGLKDLLSRMIQLG